MPEKKVLYFIGAGASVAIDPSEIPGMNMFGKMRDLFGSEWDQLRQLLSEAEINDLPGGDSIVFQYRYGPESTLLHRLNGIEPLLAALTEISSREGSPHATHAQLAYDLIIKFINRLFVHLNKIVDKASANPYLFLANRIKEKGLNECRHIFISFNYEVWLERSLQEVSMWNPSNGYLINATNPIDIRYTGPSQTLRKLPTHEYPPTRIYKPHGSLSFLVPSNDIYQTPILVLDNDDLIDNKWTKGKVSCISDSPLRLSETDYVPFIVPPIQDKGIVGEFLFKVYKDMSREITEADVIVIIGWSLPQTDSFLKQFIFSSIFKDNAKKLLIVCDKDRNDMFYNRFRSTIPSRSFKSYNSGFGPRFIDDILVPIWSGKLQ